jgi:hypothetical protein
MATDPKASQLLFLELNEVNFEYLEHYFSRGLLPHLESFLGAHGYQRTSSEETYALVEPWIQWVTAHTGQTYSEHGVLRLGDMVEHDHEQIWERLERRGLKVGAVSPMNARNNLTSAAFFVPDPWTRTRIDVPPAYRSLHEAICRSVAYNAEGKLTAAAAIDLARGIARTARGANYRHYLAYALRARSRRWLRAAFLDQLLADLFITLVGRTQPDFATLFLNGAAHVQHHYMFSSSAYDGPFRNPDWYIAPGIDPLLDIYSLYDRILGEVRARFPSARIMLATGLHQDPYTSATFYWRLADHDAFLRKIGIAFDEVQPLMSRDFVIACGSAEQALVAERRLLQATADDGKPLFEVDNRGSDLFVMLTYPDDVGPDLGFSIGNEAFANLRADVVFVALKNGHHNGTGYFSDSGMSVGAGDQVFPLSDIPDRVVEAAFC